jgi:N-acetylglucosaminyldiphosphoundecaprenol N-acetyl-beta-D-mannosaminyltransferase
MDSPQRRFATVLGVNMEQISSDELLSVCEKSVSLGLRATILPVNAHLVALASDHSWLKEYLNAHVEHVFCEGRGLQLAGKLLGQMIPDQIRFSDWVLRLFSLASRRRYSIYFLGADAETVRVAGEKVTRQFPELKLVGLHHGYFDQLGQENEQVIRSINEAHPDILLLGLSMPLEELWLSRNKEQLNAKLFVLGAGCFEWLSGKIPVCPRWLNRVGLQPLYRMVFEPRRLFRRYAIETPRFVGKLIARRFSGHM